LKLQTELLAKEEEYLSTKALLSYAEDEISRLETERMEFLSSRPACQPSSTDAASSVSSEPLESTTHIPLQRIHELEDLLACTKADVAQKDLEVKRLAALEQERREETNMLSETRDELRNSVDSLKQSLRDSDETCRTKDRRISALESKVLITSNEAANQAHHVEHDLMPALEAAKASVRSKSAKISALTLELAEMRATTDKTRSLLEHEIAVTSGNLENTMSDLFSTQELLQAAEKRVSSLDEDCLQMGLELAARDSLVESLESDLAHRCAALEVLQDRLTTADAIHAASEQKALDAVTSLEGTRAELAVAYDRLSVAEHRCERRDDELLKAESQLAVLNGRVSSLSTQVHETSEYLRISREKAAELDAARHAQGRALEDQAKLSAQKEKEFDSTTRDLLSSLSQRDSEITVLNRESSTMQRRIVQVTEELKSTYGALESTKVALVEVRASLGDCELNLEANEGQLRSKEDECNSLQAVIASQLSDIDTRDRRISSLSKATIDVEGKVAGLRAERISGEHLVSQLHSEINILKEGHLEQGELVAGLKRKVHVLTEDLRKAGADLSQRSMECDTLRNSAKQLGLNLEKSRQDHQETSHNLSEARRVSISHLEAIEHSKRQLSALESHMEGHDTLVQEYQALNETICRQQNEMDALRTEISTAANEKDALQAKLLEKSLRLDENIEAVARLSVAKTVVDAELAAIRESHDKLEIDVVKTRNILAAFQETSNKEESDLRTQIEKLQSVLDDKSKRSVEQIAAACLERDQLKESLYSIQADLDVKSCMLSRAETDLQVAQEQALDQHQTLEQLRRELADALVLKCDNKATELHYTDDLSRETASDLCSKLKSKEKAMGNLHNWCCFLNRKLHAVEKALSEREAELEVSRKAFISLSENRACTPNTDRTPVDDRGNKGEERSDEETQNASAESAFLLKELQRSEAAVNIAKESATAWRQKCDELQPMAESGLNAKRALESLEVRLALTEKESMQKIDFMNLELESCKADRDAAERECAAAVGDIAALRSRLLETHASRSSSSSLVSPGGGVYATASFDAALCRVTFTLDGGCPNHPSSSVYIVGSDAILGSWSLENRLELREGLSAAGSVVRECQVFLTPAATIEYKFVVGLADGTVHWEPGENRVLCLDHVGSTVQVQAQWRTARSVPPSDMHR
jgi:Starch binding domain